MLAGSVDHELEGEPQQAFDKVMRAIESLLPSCPGASQRTKAGYLLRLAAGDDAVWAFYRDGERSLSRLAEELECPAAAENREAVASLRRHGREFESAVAGGDVARAAEALAHFAMLLRNKRFHGDPAFSGHYVRIAYGMRQLLEVLRAHLCWLLGHEFDLPNVG